MATEYKLSYTASEIDKKLGQIDNLAAKDEIPTKTSQLTNDSGFITGYTETDPTVPSWAKQASKPSYTASEVGALPNTTKIPSKTSDLTNDSGYITGYTETDPTVPAWAKNATKPSYSKSEVGLGNVDNVKQYSASNPPPYPVTSINNKTGAVTLNASDVGARPSSWTPSYSDVGAEKSGAAAAAVSSHNTNTSAHNDIRLLVDGLSSRINALANSTDEDLDQMAEIVAYIKNNKTLIDNVTTSKVNVADIINNLTTNVSNKPLSAAQGVALKALIDALESDKLDASALSSAISTALAQAKSSGEFDGEDGVSATHKWNGTVLTVTSASGTSSADLKGAKGDPGVGAPGADGYTPVRGVDYYTDADKAEFSTYIATELAKRGQLHPEYADSIEKCTDTTKLYVLPDGMIYAYMLTEKEVESGGGYTNVITQAVNADGSEYVGNNGEDGYKKETRLSSSSKTESTSNATGMFCTGFIRIQGNSVVRIKNVKKSAGGSDCLLFFKANKTSGVGTINATNLYNTLSGDILQFVPQEISGQGEQAEWMRLSTGYTSEPPIITIDEEIKESVPSVVKEYAWASTGNAFVPADYEDRIIAVENTASRNTARIVALEKSVESGGADETEKAALERIKVWDKPVYDPAPVTLIADNRAKPALTTSDRTIDGIYAKYRALMAQYPRNITETNMGKCTASDTFTAVDMLRFDIKEPDGMVQPGVPAAALHETKPKIIFMSGVHNEWVGVWGLYYAIEEIVTNPDFDDVRRNAHIIVIPCANPYGLVKPLGEYSVPSHVNANGVAIHNNFGVGWVQRGNVGEYNYSGTEPYSELETQYIDAVMAENPDAVAFVSCHNNDYSTYYGSHVIWASSATYHMCNVAFRLVDKLSKAWLDKYGDTLKNAIDECKINMDADEYRLGRAMMSSSAGTEQLNATKYGIQATNLEISRMMKVFSGDTDGTSEVMTHGAEVYANFMRTLLWSHDPKDKKEYAPNLPWSE